MTEVLVPALVTFLLAYYLVDARIGRPIRAVTLDPLKKLQGAAALKAAQAESEGGRRRGMTFAAKRLNWLNDGLACRICVGQWVAIWQRAAELGTWKLWRFSLQDWQEVAAHNAVAAVLMFVVYLCVAVKDMAKIRNEEWKLKLQESRRAQAGAMSSQLVAQATIGGPSSSG